jgi:hypothetical protein
MSGLFLALLINGMIFVSRIRGASRREEEEFSKLNLTISSRNYATPYFSFNLLIEVVNILIILSLLITHYSLLITHYSLLITHYSLLITHYSLLITHYSLLITPLSVPWY